MNLWLVGRYKGGRWPDTLWDFQGIFSSEQRAEAACRDITYFYIPVTLDVELAHEPIHIPTTYPNYVDLATGRMTKKARREFSKLTA